MKTRTRHGWQDGVGGSAAVAAVVEAVAQGGSAAASGTRGSVAALVAGAVAQQLGKTVLMVVAHLDEADDALDDLEGLAAEVAVGTRGLSVERFPALEAAVGGAAGGRGAGGAVVVAPVQALMQGVPEVGRLEEVSLVVEAGQRLAPGRLLDWLDRAGYGRQDAVEGPGDFATRGGIVDVWPMAGEAVEAGSGRGETVGLPGPMRLDYFGDEVESIRGVDPETMGSLGGLSRVVLVGGNGAGGLRDEGTTDLLSVLPGDVVPMLCETLELSEQARGYFERLTWSGGIVPPRDLFKKLTGRPHVEVNGYSQSSHAEATRVELPVSALPSFDRDAKGAIRELGELAAEAQTEVTVVCGKPAERDRLIELLIEHVPEGWRAVDVVVGRLHRGFVWTEPAEAGGGGQEVSRVYVPHHELFHRYATRRRVRKIVAPGSSGSGGGGLASGGGDAFLDLDVGDYVVHVDHGIAKFPGLKTMSRGAKKGEYLT
ncbi:MAG: CarD family transcriptional regulator, partial [Planctomycetota bacterium]